MGVIYKITSPIGRIYVGKTTRLKHRIYDYSCPSRLKGRTSLVVNSIRKHGWQAHAFEIIEEVANDQLTEREIYWIATLNTFVEDNPFGMNMTRGGECGNTTSWRHDTERVERMSHLHKERKHTVPKWAAEKGRELMMKPVLCYSEQGVLLAEYASPLFAAQALGLNRASVARSARDKAITNGQYFFRYKDGEGTPMFISVPENIIKYGLVRPVICFLDNLMFEYQSATEASKELGVPKTTIAARAYYKPLQPMRSGLSFIYKDAFEKMIKTRSATEPLTEMVVT
jgi:hypothetical protein